jgi:hypothetical protein
MLMLILGGLALAVGIASHNSVAGAKNQFLDRQAFYLAETGWQRARQAIAAGTWTAGNTYLESFGPGQYQVAIVDNGNGTYTMTSDSYIPTQAFCAANPQLCTARRRVVETAVPVTLSGTNLSLSATASASSEQSSHPAVDANDGSTSSFWRALLPGSGQWLRMDYGSSLTLNQVVIDENGGIAGLSAVEYSNDGSSWTGVPGLSVSSSGSGSNQTWTADFTAAGAQYFRVTFTATGLTQRVSVDEFQSYGSATLGQGSFTTTW